MSSGVIIDDFDLIGAGGRPDEADTILIVYANTVLPNAIAMQCFELIRGRYAQILQRGRGIEPLKLAACHFPQQRRAHLPGALRIRAVVDVLSAGVSEGKDHRTMIARSPCYSNCKQASDLTPRSAAKAQIKLAVNGAARSAA